VTSTLGLLLKHQADKTDVEARLEKLLAAADQAGADPA
jgi:hypothetical protein